MNSTKIASIGLTAALAAILLAMPARAAGVGRTFLSAAGSDSNNCANVLTPCRHLATAYAATSPDGEIYVLDPANYGSLTITHGVSIEGHGWASIAPVAGQAAITINANVGDQVNIVGVVLDGTALSNTVGIAFISGSSLNVRDSIIRKFAQDGIYFHPNSSTQSQLFVSNTLVSDNGGNGIEILPAGSGTTNGLIDHVQMQNNNVGSGLAVGTASQTMNVTVSDSVSANNATGVSALSTSGTPVNVMVRNSTIANNIGDGLASSGSAGAIIRVTRSTITGNGTAWANFNSSFVLSYGDNNIDGNTNGNIEPPGPLTYK